jgi:hypothetical protein
VFHLANKLTKFCSYSETLWEIEFKGYRLINLVEKISLKFIVQSVAW